MTVKNRRDAQFVRPFFYCTLSALQPKSLPQRSAIGFDSWIFFGLFF